MMIVYDEKYFSILGRVTLQYSFNNKLKGSAAGTVRVTSDFQGTFSLYWGKNGDFLKIKCGEKTLSYSALHNFSINQNNGESTWTAPRFIAIPVSADSIILTDANKKPLIVMPIPVDKLLPEKTHNYSFGVIADIHYNYFFNHDKTIDYAVDAIDRALDFYKRSGVKIVCAAGDYGIYSEEKSYRDYSDAVKRSGVTVIACGGNHELYAKLDVMYGENGYWRTYMNKGIYDRSLPHVLNIADNGIDYTYMIPDCENEVFVSLSQWYWDGHTSKQPKLLEPAQLVWLEDQLKQYHDKTVILLFHTYLSDEDGTNVTGQGDLLSTGGYSYNGHYNYHTPDEKILRRLFSQYKNIIWFNGHSHYEYSMQVYNENLNIYDYEGTTATMIHVPSVTNPRTVKPDSASYSSLRGSASQGALQFVYDDFQIMNGTDLWNDEILSYACYIIYTDKKDVILQGNTPDRDICWTFSRQLNTLRITGSGALVLNESDLDQFKDEVYYLHIAKGFTSISKDTFKSLTKLRNINIKSGLVYIEDGAFNARDLKKLTLPESIKEIGSDCFNTVNPISELIYDGTFEKWNSIKITKNNVGLANPTLFKKVLIRFVTDNLNVSYDTSLGKSPVFDCIPFKNHPEDDKYYVFMGWDDGNSFYEVGKELPKAYKNTTYKAVFGAEGDRYVSGAISSSPNINWCLDRRTATLTLSGEGSSPDFTSLSDRPWDEFGSSIELVIVKSGIVSLGANTLKQIPALKKIIIENGVKALGNDCLGYNKLLKEIYIPESFEYIGKGCVYLSDNIEKVYYGGCRDGWKSFCNSVTTYYNTNLTNVKNVICAK